MEPTLFGWIWRYSWRDQATILLLTAIAMPVVYLTLELPKQIVNGAIAVEPDAFSTVRLVGIEFGQIGYLLLLCAAFLSLVVVNNAIKYVLNMRKGIVGERMLRRLRYDLYRRALRFSPSTRRNTSTGEFNQVIIAETEPLSGFASSAVATPAFQGALLFVYVLFIFVQDAVLGAAAIALYPLQAWLIPKLQRRVVVLVRERVANARRLSRDLAESVAASDEVRTYRADGWHLARMSARLHRNFDIRFRIFRLKFAIKFLNNFANQLTPFFFYAFGGYLVIRNRMDFGALVAVLAAYKDLAGPWKELLAYYQSLADTNARYDSIVRLFEGASAPEDGGNNAAIPDAASLGVRGLRTSDPVGGLQAVDAEFEPGRVTAVSGGEEDGRGCLLRALAGFGAVEAGEIVLGATPLAELSPEAAARAILRVGPELPLFDASLRVNLGYGLLRAPEPDEGEASRTRAREARLAGNTSADPDADWIDYAAAGVADRAGFDRRSRRLLAELGAEDSVFRLGLDARIDPECAPDLAREVLSARARIAALDPNDNPLADRVEFWREDTFNENATLAENLLFAVPETPLDDLGRLAREPAVARLLLADPSRSELVEIGADIARIVIDLMSGVARSEALLQEIGLVQPDELHTLPAVLERLNRRGARRLKPQDSLALIAVALRHVPARRRLGVLSESRIALVLEARPRFAKALAQERGYSTLAPRSYAPQLSVLDNLLLGKVRVEREGASPSLLTLVEEAIGGGSLRALIVEAAFEAPISDPPLRLRRKLVLARALLARPRFLALDGVADGNDPETVALRETLLRWLEGGGLIVGTEGRIEGASETLTLRDGRIVAAETGREG